MKNGLLGMVSALALASCSPTEQPSKVAPQLTRPPASARLDLPPEGPPRLFHTAIDEAFWVSHTADRDRLISSGVRLEVSPTNGEVFAAAWDIDTELKSEPLIGALEVAPHLGGGFVHWSRKELFRSETFTGPLRPVATKSTLGTETIRGARNGLDGVIVFGDNSNAKLVGTKVEAPPFVGLVDFAALDDKRAVRTNLLGSVYSTIDGGKTWRDASGTAGISLKQLLVEPDSLSVATWQGRLRLGADGDFGPLETVFVGARRGSNYSTIFRGSRAENTNAWWTWREIAPVQAAVIGGARTDERHAVAFATGAMGEVDLATAELSRSITDWPQAGLSCSAVGGFSEPLFICGWDVYQGYGSYVLRAERGKWPPVVERAFSDDGFYVADEHGALGFVGSCGLSPRYMDPNDSSRMEMGNEMSRITPKFCVRRGPNDWIEHDVDIEADEQLQAWVPKRDGNAVALVMKNESVLLPDPTNDPKRVSTQGGVRIVRIPREVGGFSLVRPTWNPYGSMGRAPAGPLVDRRLHAHDDGSVQAWFSAANSTDPSAGLHAGVVIDRRGNITMFAPPARVVTMIATGTYGLALLDDGTLAETLDHGRTYRSGGSSPLPSSGFGGYCSVLGCVIGSITRVGWGTPATNPTVRSARLDAEAPPSPALRLECSRMGTPEVVDDSLLHKTSRLAWLTGTGDAISLVREVENVPDAPPQRAPHIDGDPPDAVAPRAKPARPTTRTQSLLFRAPFDPDALPKRLDATSSELDNVRRLGVIPLLGKDGDVGLLIISDKHELVVSGEALTPLPLFEARRYMPDDGRTTPGLLLAPNQALILGDIRRRMALEEHGIGTQRAPVFLAQERDSSSRKPMALARRDDGTVGLVVWEGSPPRIAAVSELDGTARAFGDFSPLASWTTATMGDDPRCKKERGWNVLVPLDPTSWFDVKAIAAAGIELSGVGSMLVRWSAERLCIDAIDVGVATRMGYDWRYDNHLVVRFRPSGKKRRGGALLAEGTRRPIDCRLTTAEVSGP
ncbi:MAG: hypothetical protein IPM54_34890 [Polyangiaceae bacterium]|nr:hypothetical protein [Polyangiaceae bacterium]